MRKLLAPARRDDAHRVATAGIALAWQPPTLSANCAPDENSFAWTINLSEVEDDLQGRPLVGQLRHRPLRRRSTSGSAGDHDFTTARGGSTLYVRWTSDPEKMASLSGNAELCVQPEPGIQVHKSNDAADTVEPGTEVTYTYEVKNTGNTSLTDVVVKDQVMGSDDAACEPVALQSSDGNDDDILAPGETWTFSCTTALQSTTSNEACVSANVSDAEGTVDQQAEPVEACDDNTVEVSHSPEQTVEAGTGTPAGSIPNSALGGSGPNPLPTDPLQHGAAGSLGTLAYTNVKVVARRNR